MDQPPITIATFNKALHDRSVLSCGFTPIDHFLKSSLPDQVKAGMVAAWIATAEGNPTVLGFYTLGAFAVRSEFSPKAWQRARVPDIPVIYIRAVAIRHDMRGKGFGIALVIDKIQRGIGLSDHMDAAAIVLELLEDEDLNRR